MRLPKEFRFEGSEVAIEKRGRAVILTPMASGELETLTDVARYLKSRHPGAGRFPRITRTKRGQKRVLDW